LVTGYGNRWTRERVTSLRSYHGIVVYKPADDGIEPWLNLNPETMMVGRRPRAR
jgi:formylmethanofuran:tetrahydromethanopterin formyltransferase